MKKLFGNSIEPACEYCKHGERLPDGKGIQCDKNGVVSFYYFCKKFDYSPLLRIPKKNPVMPKYSKKDFTY